MTPEYRAAILTDAPEAMVENLDELERLAVERFAAMASEEDDGMPEETTSETTLESIELTPSRRSMIEARMRELSRRLFRREE